MSDLALHRAGLSTISHLAPYDVSLIGTTTLVCLHGLPKSTISDCGVRFTIYLWTFWSLLGTKPKFSIAYHPQTNDQIEVVHSRNLLRSLVDESLTTWDLIVPRAEFAYDYSCVSPFVIAHGLAPCKPLDLVPLDPHIRVSEYGVSFAQHVSQLHQDIYDRILSQYASHEKVANLHRRPRVF